MERILGIWLTNLLLTISIGNAQNKYPCETTEMGKLITKNIIKNGEINYPENDISSEQQIKDFVAVHKDDDMFAVTVARIHEVNKDSSISLQFTYHKENDACEYILMTTSSSGDWVHPIPIDSNGHLANSEAYSDKGFVKRRQKIIDSLLKYFK